MQYCYMDSPVGKLLLSGEEDHRTDRTNGSPHSPPRVGWGLRAISFLDATHPTRVDRLWVHDPPPFEEVVVQLTQYFEGLRQTFSFPLLPLGTPFQQRVWRQLQSIPYGQTATYGQIAAALGNPQASRAVGAANGRNPLPIVVPCHRVIGSTGRLVGYSCGLDIKHALLELEKRSLQTAGPMHPRTTSLVSV